MNKIKRGIGRRKEGYEAPWIYVRGVALLEAAAAAVSIKGKVTQNDWVSGGTVGEATAEGDIWCGI